MEEPNQIPQFPEKKRSKNDRRFSDEQIRSLESIFDQETKLESRKKLQLARDLGLQPRQVAIWFQNRRARWKARQIEQDYKVLKANYDTLYVQFDRLKKENKSFQMQLQELTDAEKNHRTGEFKGNIPNHEKIITHFEKIEENEEELVSWGDDEGEMNHLTSPQTWTNLGSCGLFEQSFGGIPNWWENE